jgi:hypothetical protein
VAKFVVPELGADSFSCPHCGAIAHQSWYRLFLDRCAKDAKPGIPDPAIIENIRNDRNFDRETKDRWVKYFQRKIAREVFSDRREPGMYLNDELENVAISVCYSCNSFSVWIADGLLYPAPKYAIEPADDMPGTVRPDYLEASSLVDISPRGAAALLRLCIQKLMVELKETGKDLNQDIGNLVKKGLDPRIQKALDVVRVIGNNAVHPGQMDLTDDKATAMRLFDLVNMIVEGMITRPAHLEKIYSALPVGALESIEKRDKKDK